MTTANNSADQKDDEIDYRLFACDMIQNAGILLRLPQVALATAQMLVQRAYHSMGYTFSRHHLDITAMAALFLAAKIEEHPRKVRDVIDVFTHVISTKFGREITLSYSQHETVREELIKAEKILLKTLGFNLLSSYPHKIVVNYYIMIVNRLDPDRNVWRERENNKLIQLAWNYCNDSLRLDVFIRYAKEVVACACIQMACEDFGMMFPKSTDGRPWYGLFVDDENEVRESIEIIRDLYIRKPAQPESLRPYIYLDRY